MSLKIFIRNAAAAVSTLAVVASANAAVVSVAANLPSQYIAGGSAINGSFDVNSAAGGLGYSAPYNVSGGTMTFRFSDNVDPTPATVAYYTQFLDIECFLGQCYSTGRYYFVDVTSTSFADPVERADVASGGMSGSATSDVFNFAMNISHDSGIYAATHQECSSLLNVCTTVRDKRLIGNINYDVYKRNLTYFYGYTGDFSLTMSLDSAAILDLSADGIIDFDITAGAGDFIFQSASLNVTVNENGVIPREPNGIPEPGSFMLLGLGLVGLVSLRRRQQDTFSRCFRNLQTDSA